MIEQIAKLVYELTRVEAKLSNCPVVPEPWESREEDFKAQFIQACQRYLEKGIPTPEEAHNSWVGSYIQNGWTYGPVRDPIKRTHPDLVPYWDLPKEERDKDEIFLLMLQTARKIVEIRNGDH